MFYLKKQMFYQYTDLQCDVNKINLYITWVQIIDGSLL